MKYVQGFADVLDYYCKHSHICPDLDSCHNLQICHENGPNIELTKLKMKVSLDPYRLEFQSLFFLEYTMKLWELEVF